MGFLDILNRATKPVVKLFVSDPDRPAIKYDEGPESEGLEGAMRAASRLFDRVTGTGPARVHKLRDYEQWRAQFVQEDADLPGRQAAAAAGKMQEALDSGDKSAVMRQQAKVGEEAARSMFAATQAAMARDEERQAKAEKLAQERQAGYDHDRAQREASFSTPKGSQGQAPGYDVLKGAMAGRPSDQKKWVAYAESIDKRNKAVGVNLEPGALTLKEQMETKVAQWNAADPKPVLRIDYENAPRARQGFRTDEENTAHRKAIAEFEARAREGHFKAVLPFLADVGGVRRIAQGQAQSNQGADKSLYLRGLDDVRVTKQLSTAIAPEELARKREALKSGKALFNDLLNEMELKADHQQKQRQQSQGGCRGI